MTKFSVGEKVWTKPLEEIKPIENVYIPPLIKYYCNAQFTVNCIDDHGFYILEENNNQVTYIKFAENWLESEEEHQQRMVDEMKPVEKLDVLATRALEHFGATPQICQTMEECAELIQALNKSLRHQDDPEKVKHNILEELADVTIMVEQMKLHFDEDEEFDEILEAKMDKLRSYLSEQEAD